MIGLVLVTHGNLADEFRAALEHVVGAQSKLATICIGPDDNMEKRRQDIVDAISTVDGGKGVVLLTDMFGGTPSNLAISLLEKDHVEEIAGINLPMLIKFSSIRETMDLQEAVLEAKEAAQKYISVASEVLGNS